MGGVMKLTFTHLAIGFSVCLLLFLFAMWLVFG